jgi:hypothetical protein
MSINYTPITDFLVKDTLPKEDPDKVILGADFDGEFEAISTAFLGAASVLDPTFSGTVTFDVGVGKSLTVDTLTTTGDVDVGGSITATDLTLTGGLSLPGGDIATEDYVDDRINEAVLAPITELDDISDVNTAAATDGQFLKWDGTEWVGGDVNLNNITGGLAVDGAIIEDYEAVTSVEDNIGGIVANAGGAYDYAYNPAIPPFIGGGVHFINVVPDGGTAWIHKVNSGVYYNTMSTPFDMNTFTGTWIGPYDVLSGFDESVHWSPDGTKFLTTFGTTVVEQYSVTTPYDMSTAVSMGTYIHGTSVHSASWEPDGLTLWLGESNIVEIAKVTFATAFDITSTATLGTPFRTDDLPATQTHGSRTGGNWINNGTAFIQIDTAATVSVYYLNTPYTFDDGISGYAENTNALANGTGNYCSVMKDGEYLLATYSDIVEQWNMFDSASAVVLDASTTNNFEVAALTAPCVLTFSNVPTTGETYACTIEIQAAGNTVTWPTGTIWPTATPPTLSAGKDVFVLTTHDGGTTWHGFTAGQEMG